MVPSAQIFYQKRSFILAVIVFIAVLVSVWATLFLPSYLLYETPPIDADVVVVFGGNDFEARKRQAQELIDKGRVSFMIVPFQGRIYATRKANTLIAPTQTTAIVREIRTKNLRFYVEETHIEMLQTLKLLAYIQASRAIIVSSPYHMRRIQVIADLVLDPHIYTVAFVPTAYAPPNKPWFTSRVDVKWVFSELGKISWLRLYSPFYSPTY